VKRVYTDLAVIDVTPQGFVVAEMVGISREELQAKTGAKLAFAPDCKPLTAPTIEVTD
jgi:acyl CoA:acetate/3-ketoacid CoA transferase beta subunit